MIMETKLKPPTQKQLERLCAAGWHWRGYYWNFLKSGKIYDLSAANLDMLDYIEKNGHFLVRE